MSTRMEEEEKSTWDRKADGVAIDRGKKILGFTKPQRHIHIQIERALGRIVLRGRIGVEIVLVHPMETSRVVEGRRARCCLALASVYMGLFIDRLARKQNVGKWRHVTTHAK